jgi:hypothetical protein
VEKLLNGILEACKATLYPDGTNVGNLRKRLEHHGSAVRDADEKQGFVRVALP